MNMKKIISMTLVVLLAMGALFAMGGCNKNTYTKPEAQKVTDDTANNVGYQLEMPEDGEEIAIIHTSMGDITLRLFPEAAPKAVANFINLAKEGKYNGVKFHRVVEDFMIQTGDYENGDGTGGKGTPDETFEDEFTNKLFNITGAVAMANSGVNTNGSQFFINISSPDSFDPDNYDYDTLMDSYESTYEMYKESYGYSFYSSYKTLASFIDNYVGGISPLSFAVPDEVWDLYKANGGNISLDGAFRASGGHTVFAQVIDGMDVVEKIAAAEVTTNSSGESSQPVEDITITSVEITTYKAN